ncbi:hypothetical protein MTR67_006365 [Solanum verrucosum]|uniref:TF-B3 domain-containing protein n=1 Tax=Solanum verrucosum TaxID=315347 RepID=A0AAF0Q021_SOLVR|nr:hypothetical protein MTR67_006365 [Solanum verrucosum]
MEITHKYTPSAQISRIVQTAIDMMENSLLKIDKRAIFYKIFCPSITNELRIPAHFLRHISEESPDKATLKCLSGGTWNVKLQCDEDGLLIHKGWKKFQKNNQLENGEYLVFRYDGALQFTIRIFSKNGLERQMKSTNMVKNKQASIDGGSKRKRPEKFPKQTCANGENDTEHETPRKRAALEKEEDLLTPNIPQFVKCLKGYNVKKSCFLFVSDNKLKEGQVCAFQLVNANEVKVSVFNDPSESLLKLAAQR